MNVDRVVEAIAWAAAQHGDQRRKGSGTPYLFHLLAVASLVAEHGGSEAAVLGAVLHDVIEDSQGKGVREQVAGRFGDEVAGIVEACSDSPGGPKAPWRGRKESFVASLDGASDEVRLVVAADKLHNARSTARDLRAKGAGVWSIFQGGRDGTLWYYDEVLAALGRGWSHRVLDELRREVDELHVLAGDTET